MKKIALFLLLFPSLLAFSQMPTFTIGMERPMPNIKNPETYPFRYGNSNYVLFKNYSIANDMQLQLYGFSDPNDKLACMETISVPQQVNEIALYEGFVALTNKMLIFRSVFKKAEKKASLYAHEVSERGVVATEGTELTSIEAEKTLNQGDFFIKASADGKSFVVLAENPFAKETKEKLAVSVYDNSLKQIWRMESELQYESKRGPMNNVILTNSGVVYLIKKVEGPKNADFYTSYHFSAKGTKVTENLLEMPLPQKIINYEYSIEETSGDLFLAGYYTEDGKVTLSMGGTSYNGVYNFRISSSTGTLTSKNTSPFEKSQKNLQILGLVQLKKNLLLIGEVKYLNRVTTSEKDAKGFPVYNQEYISGDLLISTFDEAGKSLATTRLPFEGKSVEDGGLFSAVGHAVVGEQLMFVFNDYQYKHDGEKHTVVGPMLANVKIPVIQFVDAEGKLGKEFAMLGSNIGGKSSSFALYPGTCMPIRDKEFFFLCRGENKTIDPVRMKLP